MKEGVVLLHGILRTNRCMKGLTVFLEKENYEVLNLDYPSSKYDILSIAKLIHSQIKNFSSQTVKTHYVGYSMGGLIIRAYLHLYRPSNLGRVIMLGTPNQGSEIADFLKPFGIYKILYGPAGQQLITDQKNIKKIFGNINYELGIIAGSSPFYLLANKIIGKKSDGRVSIVNTKIEGMKEHIIIKSGHTMLASNKTAWRLTLSFLKTGNFL